MAGIDERMRFASLLSLIERGVAEADAGLATFALHPLESDAPCSRALQRHARKRSKRLARQVGTAAPEQVGPLAAEAIRDYLEMAQSAGDVGYSERFRLVLSKQGHFRSEV